MREYYENLLKDYVNLNCPWTYIWNYDGKEYGLDFKYNNENKIYYALYIDGVFIRNYESINEGLDKIMLGEKTLRETIMNTNFVFDAIL